MKVLIKNDKGLEREISPENLIISGQSLAYYLDEIHRISNELKELKNKYDVDVKEMNELWGKLNLL